MTSDHVAVFGINNYATGTRSIVFDTGGDV